MIAEFAEIIHDLRGPTLLHYIGIEDAVLLEVVGDCVLGQERGLHVDFGADPFSFVVGRVEWVIAASAAAELGTEVGVLDLVELLDAAPGFVACRAGDVDL